MRIADTRGQPNASTQLAKSDTIRQIEQKTLFDRLYFPSQALRTSSHRFWQALLGMVIGIYAPVYTWELPVADVDGPRRCMCILAPYWKFLTKPGKWDHLRNRTTLIPSPFGGRTSQVWLYTEQFVCCVCMLGFAKKVDIRNFIRSQPRIVTGGRLPYFSPKNAMLSLKTRQLRQRSLRVRLRLDDSWVLSGCSCSPCKRFSGSVVANWRRERNTKVGKIGREKGSS